MDKGKRKSAKRDSYTSWDPMRCCHITNTGKSCSIPAYYNCDGKWYCHHHDPRRTLWPVGDGTRYEKFAYGCCFSLMAIALLGFVGLLIYGGFIA